MQQSKQSITKGLINVLGKDCELIKMVSWWIQHTEVPCKQKQFFLNVGNYNLRNNERKYEVGSSELPMNWKNIVSL